MRQLQCLLYKNRCYQAGVTIKPTKIVVHSTGADNTTVKRYVQPHSGQSKGMKQYLPTEKTYTRAQMLDVLGTNPYGNDWNRDDLDVCVHAFIGKLADGSIAVVQTLPWAMRCWGCGSGSKGSYNNCAMQFEICEDDHSDAAYCKATYEEAAELCARLCRAYGLDETDIVSHKEACALGYASNHGDPEHWWTKHGLSMNKFRARVKELLATDSSGETEQEEPKEEPKELYRVRKSWSDAASQIGAYEFLDNAKKACKAGYKVFDSNGQVVYQPAESPAESDSLPYEVKISTNNLYIRKGAGTNYKTNGFIPLGVYTIVEEASGQGSVKGWGKLKSGAGWVSLDYCTKL